MWKCNKCNKEFERLDIAWGICCGKKVDVLDYCCPHCYNPGYKDSNQPLTFLGTEEERNIYWDNEWDNKYTL